VGLQLDTAQRYGAGSKAAVNAPQSKRWRAERWPRQTWGRLELRREAECQAALARGRAGCFGGIRSGRKRHRRCALPAQSMTVVGGRKRGTTRARSAVRTDSAAHSVSARLCPSPPGCDAARRDKTLGWISAFAALWRDQCRARTVWERLRRSCRHRPSVLAELGVVGSRFQVVFLVTRQF